MYTHSQSLRDALDESIMLAKQLPYTDEGYWTHQCHRMAVARAAIDSIMFSLEACVNYGPPRPTSAAAAAASETDKSTGAGTDPPLPPKPSADDVSAHLHQCATEARRVTADIASIIEDHAQFSASLTSYLVPRRTYKNRQGRIDGRLSTIESALVQVTPCVRAILMRRSAT